jgi:predicted ester cyclase
MTRAEIITRLERHRDAFIRHDADALAADHSPEGSFESPAHGQVRGRAAISDVYRYWFTAFPDLLLTWEAPIVDGDRAAVFWTFSGTSQGPFFGIVGAGSRVELRGAAEYLFGEDGIASVRHTFDFSSMLLKTGVLKVKPGA